MTKWEFIKQENIKAYYVYKNGEPVCKIRYGNTIVGQVYTVVNNLHDLDGVSFSKLIDAKYYIKLNY